MQAIILAAGMGKRLGELTRENTKCMVKVREQTLIERMIRQLSESNVKRIIIVKSGMFLLSFVGIKSFLKIKNCFLNFLII